MPDLVTEAGGRVRVTLGPDDAFGIPRLEALGHASALGQPVMPSLLSDLPDGGLAVDLPGHPQAVAFLARWCPRALGRHVEDLVHVGHVANVSSGPGGLVLSVGYVGDAGGGECEPHDAVWDDSCSLVDALAEAGIEAEVVASDHDSFSMALRPALLAGVRRAI